MMGAVNIKVTVSSNLSDGIDDTRIFVLPILYFLNGQEDLSLEGFLLEEPSAYTLISNCLDSDSDWSIFEEKSKYF